MLILCFVLSHRRVRPSTKERKAVPVPGTGLDVQGTGGTGFTVLQDSDGVRTWRSPWAGTQGSPPLSGAGKISRVLGVTGHASGVAVVA